MKKLLKPLFKTMLLLIALNAMAAFFLLAIAELLHYDDDWMNMILRYFFSSLLGLGLQLLIINKLFHIYSNKTYAQNALANYLANHKKFQITYTLVSANWLASYLLIFPNLQYNLVYEIYSAFSLTLLTLCLFLFLVFTFFDPATEGVQKKKLIANCFFLGLVFIYLAYELISLIISSAP